MGKKGIEYLTSLKKQPKHRAMLQMIPGIIIDCIRVLFIAIVRGTFAVHFFFFLWRDYDLRNGFGQGGSW